MDTGCVSDTCVHVSECDMFRYKTLVLRGIRTLKSSTHHMVQISTARGTLAPCGVLISALRLWVHRRLPRSGAREAECARAYHVAQSEEDDAGHEEGCGLGCADNCLSTKCKTQNRDTTSLIFSLHA